MVLLVTAWSIKHWKCQCRCLPLTARRDAVNCREVQDFLLLRQRVTRCRWSDEPPMQHINDIISVHESTGEPEKCSRLLLVDSGTRINRSFEVVQFYRCLHPVLSRMDSRIPQCTYIIYIYIHTIFRLSDSGYYALSINHYCCGLMSLCAFGWMRFPT